MRAGRSVVALAVAGVVVGLAGVILLVSACTPEAGHHAPGRGRLEKHLRATVVVHDSLPRSALPAAVWAMRDSIAALWDNPDFSIEMSSGRFEGFSRGRWYRACRLKVHAVSRRGSGPEDGTGDAEMVGSRLEESGWTHDIGCDADGPDGTTFGLRGGGVFCLISAEWDGGDDSDSTYVPRPNYTVTVDFLEDRRDFCPPY